MKKHKNKMIAGVIILIILAGVFWYGGDSPTLHGWTPKVEQPMPTPQNTESPEAEIPKEEPPIEETLKEDPVMTETPETKAPVIEPLQTETPPPITEEKELPKQQVPPTIPTANPTPPPKADKYKTDPIPTGKPVPVEPEDVEITEKNYTCILSVRCDTILNNIQWLSKEKADIVPENGVIFEERTVTFYEGESVFNLLVREMKKNKIHLEFVNTPIYNSAYIEGIANLYEFDCGELSGWMYKVNDWFPNYGCSRYQLKDGDRVEWVYTCDLGVDVGGGYSARNGNKNE